MCKLQSSTSVSRSRPSLLLLALSQPPVFVRFVPMSR